MLNNDNSNPLTDSFDLIDTIVSRVLNIDDYTYGDAKKGYLIRYRGRLRYEDTAAAYDQLANALRPMSITPLFRWENNKHSVILIKGVVNPKPSKAWVNLILFIVTLFSVILTGGLNALSLPLPSDPLQLVWQIIVQGLPFAIAMIAILAAHEFGHYFAGRMHGVHVTLPYFIPMPFSPFGTMGAFINMKEPARNRRVLLDIGIAGPLAGLVVSLPVLIYGLSLSKVETLPYTIPSGTMLQMEGNSLLYLLLKFVMFGKLLPQPESYGSLPAVVYWVRYFFTGIPFPWGGVDVMLHPVAWAGWAGLLVTSLNLIPAGQLDGGHVFYVLFGSKAAQKIRPLILAALVLLGFAWFGWWLWAFIIFFLGRFHAEPLDQITELDGKRKILAVILLVIFILTFIPVPLMIY